MRLKPIYIVLLLVLILAGGLLLSGCSGNSDDSRNTVYEDMKASFDSAGLLSANIGIFSRTEQEGSVTYGEGGAALNEQMQLIGTVPGGSFSLDGKTVRFGVLIPAGEIKICLDEWKQQ